MIFRVVNNYKYNLLHISGLNKNYINRYSSSKFFDFSSYHVNLRRKNHHLPLYLVYVQFASEDYKITWVYNGNYFGFLNMRYGFQCTNEESIQIAKKDFVDIPDKVKVFIHDDVGNIKFKEYREERPSIIVERLVLEDFRVVKQVWRRRWWQGGSFHWDDFWPWS